MLLDLLESWFNLKLRIETEEIPVYALTIANGGLKMKPLESVKYEELRKIRASFDQTPRPPTGPDPNSEAKAKYAGLLGCSFLPDAVRSDPVELTRFREAVRRGVKPPECFATPGGNNGPNAMFAFGGSPIGTLVNALRTNSSPMPPSLPHLPLFDTLNGLLVVDKTGLPDFNCLIEIPPAGTPCAPLFNIVAEFAIDESFFTELEKRGIPPAEMGVDLSLPKAPNVFKALERLGLQLEKTKASREFIVIEHIERPSPN